MSKQSKHKSPMPTSGRIGRIAKKIEQATDRSVVVKVMAGARQVTKTFTPKEKAAWLRDVTKRLENIVGNKKSKQIMESCGRQCCGITSRKAAQKLMAESKTTAEFITKLNKKHLGGGRLKMKDKHTITGGYDVCYCGLVKYTEESFPTKTYCHCGVGWYKQLFESALGKPVRVELVQSIIMGAKSCEFIIHI